MLELFAGPQGAGDADYWFIAEAVLVAELGTQVGVRSKLVGVEAVVEQPPIGFRDQTLYRGPASFAACVTEKENPLGPACAAECPLGKLAIHPGVDAHDDR